MFKHAGSLIIPNNLSTCSVKAFQVRVSHSQRWRTKQLTYSAVLTDIYERSPRERSRWSRRTARTAAATAPRPPSLLAAAEIPHAPDRGFWKRRWGDFKPKACQTPVWTSTWHSGKHRMRKRNNETSVTWRCRSESRSWLTARSPMNELRWRRGRGLFAFWPSDSHGRVQTWILSVFYGKVPQPFGIKKKKSL